MKKVLATVLAAGMALSLSSVAFAANNVVQGGVIGASVENVTGTTTSKYEAYGYVLLDQASDNVVFEDGLPELYTWGNDDSTPYSEVKIALIPASGVQGGNAVGPFFRITAADAHINTDNISVSIKRNDGTAFDPTIITIKAKAGVRDFELEDYEFDVDMTIGEYNQNADGSWSTENKEDITVTFKKSDGVAYSLIQEVQSDEKYTVTKKDGAIFDFDEVIDEEVRIRCNEYVDVFFKGNYGTDYENMRVVTDDIAEVEAYFDDVDVDYYDFIGTPKFATKVKVVVDADPGSYIYEYDKSTGDLTKIDATYESDGWAFTTKNLGTYIITEEEYDGGNVNTDEDVDTEPTEEVDQPTKENPGTGAYEL